MTAETVSLRRTSSKSRPQGSPAVSAPARRLPPNLRILPDDTRNMGVSLWAARGAGKSRLLGRLLAWQDFCRSVPLVILDPIGGTIDHLLDKILRRPLPERRELWTRIRYLNMNGQDGRVWPFPIYAPAREGERASVTAQRYLDVITRSDPELARAPILGLNAITPLAQAGGILLTSLGLGVTELWNLLTEPSRWEPRIRTVAASSAETQAAAEELSALWRLPAREQTQRLNALKSKLSLFAFQANFRAIFGATTPAISWAEVVRERQAVLLDFRDVQSAAIKKFCLLWVYSSFLTFVKQRGHGRHTPISFIIDELTYLVGTAGMHTELLTADIDELINRISRSHSVWLTLAGQELFQLPETLRQTVLSMGTVLFGQTSDYRMAEELARRYYRYDPHLVRKEEAVSSVIPPSGGVRWPGQPTEYGVHTRTTEYTRDEQNYLNSRHFLEQLKPFHFLLGQSPREGELPTTLTPISTARLDAGQFPERERIDRVRSELTLRDGVPEERILTEIAARTETPPGRQATPDPAGTRNEPPPQPVPAISRRPRRTVPPESGNPTE